MESHTVKTIGVVGGVASGKSRAAQMLVEMGAGLLDADQAGHAVLAEDEEVREVIRRWWGPAVFDADGSIDRRAVASRVFADGDRAAHDRQFLEELLHPRIRSRLERQREEFQAEGRPAVVLDAPLLLEAGWGQMCDVVLMVDAPREVRLERAKLRGWSESQFSRREAAQWAADKKRPHADAVIDNGGSEEQLRDAIQTFWHEHVQPHVAA
jgi:dephospho-CoA kinase